MDYMKILNDVSDFILKNYTLVLCIGVFIIIVIIGYFADKRVRNNKKSKEVIPIVKEEVKSNNLPAVEEISVPALEPAIDIIPEPELNYETSYNDFQSIESPFTLEKFNEDKVDINTMSGTTADISPEIDKIFQDFNFGEEKSNKVDESQEPTEDVKEEPVEPVLDKEEIPKEEEVQINDIVNKIEEAEDNLVDNDMDYEDIKPDKSIFDEIKPYNNDQDNINNLF
ncbi:MAG TPA: hypothetical protein PKY25_01595 [Bacilli bacterium]|nr:hypothetical protein [Bacilli bacterium]